MTMAKSTKLDGWTTATRKGKKGTTVQSEWKRRMKIKKLSEEIEKARKKDEKMDIQMESAFLSICSHCTEINLNETYYRYYKQKCKLHSYCMVT